MKKDDLIYEVPDEIQGVTTGNLEDSRKSNRFGFYDYFLKYSAMLMHMPAYEKHCTVTKKDVMETYERGLYGYSRVLEGPVSKSLIPAPTE